MHGIESDKAQSSKNPESSSEDGTSVSDSPKIKLTIRRCKISQSKCIVCNDENNRVRIKPRVALKAYVDTGISELLNDLREEARKRRLNFNDPSALDNKDYYGLAGLANDQFNYVALYLLGKVRSTKCRSIRECLALLSIKLRAGLSNAILSTLFEMEERRVGRGIMTARTGLMSFFVPHHLGVGHISPESVTRNHTTSMAKTLFANGEDVCILVADGRCILILKSSNYSLQRRTFSFHKGRNLVKPMMLVTTTGYTVDVFGPYFADSKNNDASIFNSLLKQDSTRLRTWMPPNSVFVVDRGFWDCLMFLEDLGFVSKMPHFFKKGSQHSVTKANESRLITKV